MQVTNNSPRDESQMNEKINSIEQRLLNMEKRIAFIYRFVRMQALYAFVKFVFIILVISGGVYLYVTYAKSFSQLVETYQNKIENYSKLLEFIR